MSTPQRRRTPLPPPVMVALIVGAAVSLIRGLIPALRTEQWEWLTWVLVAFQVIVLVTVMVYFVRFLREQKDDYWRERGKDPKHPEV
jgi:hypothetical protein